MEHLALGLVWLPGLLVFVSPMFQQVHMKKMDIASYSFDDQYLGCSSEMEAKLKELNRTEFVPNSNYANAWKEAITRLQGRWSGSSVLQPVQAIALMAYTLNDPPLHKEFNEAVLNAGYSRKEYFRNFHFKVLHFLLTEAIRKLRDDQHGQCYNVYRGIKDTVTAQPGDTVRFGYFASSSLDRWRAENYGKVTVFSVKTCYGALIENFAKSKDHREVLIPPFETFEVTSVTPEGTSNLIKLRSKSVHSNYSCEFVRGQSVTLAPLWGFLLAATALATALGI